MLYIFYCRELNSLNDGEKQHLNSTQYSYTNSERHSWVKKFHNNLQSKFIIQIFMINLYLFSDIFKFLFIHKCNFEYKNNFFINKTLLWMMCCR